MDPDLLIALKALSDASRLRIVGVLAEGKPVSVEELARRLSLSPGTVVHHLNRLRAARLVESKPRRPYMDYSLRLGRLAEIGAGLSQLDREQRDDSPADAPGWATAEEAKVIRSFFDNGLLSSVPAQRSKRLMVLHQLAETVFERKRRYPEKEVNQRLGAVHPDPASLRRYLVDEGFMARKSGEYRLRPRSDWPRTQRQIEDQRSRASASADTAEAPAS
jgi:ArsR family transcriptional regulator, arsenate/arsenite/antimonite-responsive transcriptional repressor